ncbi:MIZU-KUSSEI-like protein [Actinidia rufa]|uniref:MIZU-KUSSEI-like protein n=1 Tax=Actinidia rufa TaxID=165716 RepID=A0A7J0H5Z3_9ERIC|nr:MIZU-KUSSEI-like protein [Actinidia rufa]
MEQNTMVADGGLMDKCALVQWWWGQSWYEKTKEQGMGAWVGWAGVGDVWVCGPWWMKTITSKTPHDSSFSFSRRYFYWNRKVEEQDDEEEILTFSSSSRAVEEELKVYQLDLSVPTPPISAKAPSRKLSTVAVSKLRSALTIFSKSLSHSHAGLGTRVVGTLFGYRRGHVHLAFQEDSKLTPGFLVELATPTSVLIREMASGLVRIALECDKKAEKKGLKLLEEPIWRTFCNGKKCRYAVRREPRAEEWNVLKAVGPVSMGAVVLPVSGNGAGGSDGELMYMRAKFERVVGSKDSEAFYMMNPDGHGGPELSIYLLRV